MSLVGLKTLLFERGRGTRAASQAAANQAAEEPEEPIDLGRLGSRASTAINSNAGDVDLEAQSVQGEVQTGAQDEAQDEAPGSLVTKFKIPGWVISNATLGLTDGLTVPFALTAGLSALGNTRVVIFGGLAELIAGSISMGLGGYLGAKSELASYRTTRHETQQLVDSDPAVAVAGVRAALEAFDIPAVTLDQLTKHLASSPRLVDFVMQVQHCESEPAASRAIYIGLTVATGYFGGGILPLIPYLCVHQDLYKGLYISIAVMAVTLFAFGYLKTCAVVGWRKPGSVRKGVWGGVEMVMVGGLAAGAAMGLVRAFNHAVGPTV